MELTPDRISRLETALSVARFSRYVTLAGGDRELAFRLHHWNTELSEALHCPLQTFELLLRNNMHLRLTARYGEFWFDSEFNRLDSWAQRKIRSVSDKLRNMNRARTAPAIVAQLTFGFWMNLLTSRAETHFWIQAIRHVFPTRARSTVHDAVQPIVDLRNRIAHHEPVYFRNLSDDLQQIIGVASWMCPTTARWIDFNGTRLRELVNNRPSATSVRPNQSDGYERNYAAIDWSR